MELCYNILSKLTCECKQEFIGILDISFISILQYNIANILRLLAKL